MQAPVPTDPTLGTEPTHHGFAADYPFLPDTPDELFEPDGSLRPHWQMFVAMLDELGPAALARRWDQARRLIHDNGVSHNVYGDPQGLDRPWNLDAIPLLIPDEQWSPVSAALAQRARLLDRLLADIYGPATTVYERVLPPDLIWANPAFLRPCSGITPSHDRWLHLYAADLIRTPAGEFQVLSDRTQAPSGAGYCLENRIVLSRILPSEYRQSNVRRLAPYFAALRDSLAAIAPANTDSPRVVLLTPGPYNETYFEHAYLARYLGYALVQGNDLTVRDSRVYLKTLSGLQRVDVILRRVDDNFCDPVELFQSSYLGVPGLLQAVRQGTVTIANALGSGVLQAPGILPYLPAICRHLLGEDLLINSVPTWWCGDPSSLSYVQGKLSSLVIKSAFPTPGERPIFAARLSQNELYDLSARINHQPYRFVAQQQVMDTSAPAMVDNHLLPRRFVVRSFLTAPATPASGVEPYTPMQGALTRITGNADSRSVSLQQGAGSKDTWILAPVAVPHASLLPATGQPVPIVRSGGDLPSRLADDLFWLGRYVERADAMARLARGTLALLIDQNSPQAPPALSSLAITILSACLPQTEGSSLELDRALTAALFDTDSPSSLEAHGRTINRLARGLRDQISTDAWRALQSIARNTASFRPDPDHPPTAILDILDSIIEHCAAFAGLVTDSMTRGQAWLFLDLGRRIERATSTAHLLLDSLCADHTCPPQDDPVLLEAILEVTDSSITYRRRYLAHLETHAVVDLLVSDNTNPRAVAFQLAEIQRHLTQLPRIGACTAAAGPTDTPDLTQLQSSVESLTVSPPPPAGAASATPLPLVSVLRQTMSQLADLTNVVTRHYFSHSALQQGLSQQLTSESPNLQQPDP